MGFGKKILHLRKGKRISAERLADILGVNAGRLRKWEELDFEPRADDVAKIESVFRMKMSDIMELEELPELKKVPNKKGGGSLSIEEASITLQVRAEARQGVILSALAEILANQKGSTVDKIKNEFADVATMEELKLRKKYGLHEASSGNASSS